MGKSISYNIRYTSYYDVVIEHLLAELRRTGSIRFTVRVHPGARKTAWKGPMADDTLKIDIAAVPEDGEANLELVRFLASEFDVGRDSVEILSGQRGRRKVVRISM